jgi:hypothetical protein
MGASMENFFRWLLFVPASVIAGWLAYVVFLMTYGVIIPDYGFLSSLRVPIKTFVEFVASGAMGAVFAFMVSRIVPTNKKMTTYISSAVAGFIVSISAGLGIAQGNFSPSLMAVGLLIGLGVACWSISEDDIKA